MADLAFVIGGLALLALGAEALVRGATSLALRFGLPATVVGLTVVAWGTSFPELVVSLDASLRGMPDIALANAIGSNIYNIVLILGLTGLISGLAVHRSAFTLDLPVMVAAAGFVWLFSLDGTLGRPEASALVLGLVGFTARLVQQGVDSDTEGDASMSVFVSLLGIVVGMVMLGFGARGFTSGAVAVAQDLGVSQRVIGLTLVAFGTSLPELFTSVWAAVRGQADIAVGNVVGSNIINMLGIIGVAALVRPIPVDPAIATSDYGWLMGLSLLLVVLLYTDRRLARWEGAVLLGAGVAYTWTLW